MVTNRFVDSKIFFEYWRKPICLLAKALEEFFRATRVGPDKISARDYWPYFFKLQLEAEEWEKAKFLDQH
jgi:hypothetical protein